jgi:hypothetical protein
MLLNEELGVASHLALLDCNSELRALDTIKAKLNSLLQSYKTPSLSVSFVHIIILTSVLEHCYVIP